MLLSDTEVVCGSAASVVYPNNLQNLQYRLLYVWVRLPMVYQKAIELEEY